MALLEYEDISKLLNLNIEDKDFDELCLNAAYTEIEKQIGYPLEKETKYETITEKDNRIILDTINLIKVNENNRPNKKKLT